MGRFNKDFWNEFWEYIKKSFRKNWKILLLYVIVFSVIYELCLHYLPQPSHPEEVTYSEFLTSLHNGDVDTVYYNIGRDKITYTLYNDETREMSVEEREQYDYPNENKKTCKYPNYQEFTKDVLESGANMAIRSNQEAAQVLSSFLSVLIWIVFILLITKTMQGKPLSEKDLIQTSDVTFDDVIGLDEIIDDVKFLTRLIKDPSIGDEIGVKMPKGVLFTGPPGTGKTLLAQAMANEAGVTFINMSSSAFIEMFVGLGAKRVRDVFKIARKHTPCIIFFDEFDAVALKRGSNRTLSEHDQTINQILQEMDGFKKNSGIFVIAATNKPEELDEAVVRAGRFDRQVAVNPPRDWEVRKQMFKHYLGKLKVDESVDIDGISKEVAGFTGADIQALCNEAGIKAIMHDKHAIDADSIEEAIDETVFKGNRSKKKSLEHDREIIAYHESGHAIMSMLLGEPISRASIKSTTSGVGGAVFNSDKETVFMTDTDLRNKVKIAYAGRASEEIKFTKVTTGASNDITQATNVMLNYIEKLGFDKDFGLLDISVLSENHLVNGDSITQKLSQMSIELYKECKELLEKNYDKVETLAQKLLEYETLSGSEIEELFNKDKIEGSEEETTHDEI